MYNVGIFPKVYGGTYPAMIFSAYMKQFLAGQTVVDFAPPDRVPNQRAPKFLNLEGELEPTQSQRQAAQNNNFNNTSGSSNNSNSNSNSSNDAPVGDTTPQRPVVSVPPVIPQFPTGTVPSVPDITIPRVVVPPPPVFDTTPTTRRNRG